MTGASHRICSLGNFTCDRGMIFNILQCTTSIYLYTYMYIHVASNFYEIITITDGLSNL